MRTRLLVLALLSAVIIPLSATAINLARHDEPKELPAITFLDAEGNELTLEDFRGKVVVLNLWATWCAPCRREMPSLDRLQAEHGGEDLHVLPLSVDRGEIDKVEEFYEEVGLEHLDIYRDPSAKVTRDLHAPGLPTTILIDREGREIGRVLGPDEWDSDEAIALLQEVVAE